MLLFMLMELQWRKLLQFMNKSNLDLIKEYEMSLRRPTVDSPIFRTLCSVRKIENILIILLKYYDGGFYCFCELQVGGLRI